MSATQGQQLLLVVNHLSPAQPGERVVALEENGLLRTDFLTEAAEDAPEHVDLEFLGHLLRIATVGGLSLGAGRRDLDGLGRTHEFAKLARDALGVALLILHEIGRAAITLGHDPFLLGILHRDRLPAEDRVHEMPRRHLEPAPDGREIEAFPEGKLCAFNNHAVAFNFSLFFATGFALDNLRRNSGEGRPAKSPSALRSSSSSGQ